MIGLIYEKTLRLSPATNKKFKSGDLITFIQVDVNKLNFLCYQAPSLVILPIILIGGFYFLYQYLDLVFLVGIGIFFLGFLANMTLSTKNARYQKLYMKFQEKRVSLMSECLANIKTLKIFSWTKVFEEKLEEIRK